MRVDLPCPIADPAQGPSNSSERYSRTAAFRKAWRDYRRAGRLSFFFRSFS